MGDAHAPVPAVLSEVQRLAAAVLADGESEVGEDVQGEPRLVAHDVGEVLLRGRADDVHASSIIGSPNPLADWKNVLPASLDSPEMCPMGTMIAAIAPRSKSENMRE